MTRILKEGFDYMDLEGILLPRISVDEYRAKTGSDADMVTLAFTIKSKNAGKDLVSWFERGYDFVVDAKLSDGELSNGKYLVFVELKRRSSVPKKIVELLEDLETLTGFKLTDWTVKIYDEFYEADEQELGAVIIKSASDYKKIKENQDDLNEMRQIAGLKNVDYHEVDADIRKIKTIAGL